MNRDSDITNELKQKLINHQAKQIAELAEALRAVQQTIGYCTGRDFASADRIILPQLQCCYETIAEVLKIVPHHRETHSTMKEQPTKGSATAVTKEGN